MDSQAIASTPTNQTTSEPQGFPKNIFTKLKNLTKTQKILLLLGVIAVIGLITFLFTRQSSDKSANETIAMVGNTAIPRRYLDIELEYYPATQSAETDKFITEKLVNDEVTLQYGREQGWVDSNVDLTATNNESYLARTGEVKKIRQRIESEADGISGSTVAIWFRNNGYVGPLGLAKGRETAYNKLLPLYERVKNQEISMRQASQIIIDDASLKTIDPSYDSNAYAAFKVEPGKQITFWPEFDQMLKSTKPGELTQLYLGKGPDEKGNPVDELYIFGQIDSLEGGKGYSSYEGWLELRKKSLGLISFSIKDIMRDFSSWNEVLAQENDNNQHGTPAWQGFVETPTGLRLRDTLLTFSNPCIGSGYSNPRDALYKTYTNSQGTYSQEAMPYINCGCNPNTVKAYVPIPASADTGLVKNAYAQALQQCQTVTTEVRIPNQIATVTHNIVCSNPNLPSPPPTPPPPTPACNVSCSTNEFCATAPDGCTSCIAGTCQKCEPKPAETRTLACPPGQTGSITETRTWACPAASWSAWTATSNTCTPPPACGDNCTSDSYCFGAPDGCVSCVPNNAGTGKVCSKPPVCGSSCVRDDQCIGDAAKNGCTACVSGVCRTPPACGTACTTKADCAGSKDNCSECLEGTCTDYNKDMCKCDGLVAELDYPNNFKFEAFGMVKGADKAKAEIADITFRMTKDGGTVIAKSNPITPQIVENTSEKIRFKAAWQTAPPPVSPNSTYRVFADVRCKPKRIVSADAAKSPAPVAQTEESQTLPPPKGLVLLTDLINMAFGGNGEVKAFTGKVLAQMSTPTPAPKADTNLQLRTLNFVKLMDTNNCNFVRFKFDESLF